VEIDGRAQQNVAATDDAARWATLTVGTKIGDRVVLAVERLFSPIRDGNGRPVEFRRMAKVLFEDGSEAFACRVCLFVGKTQQSIGIHIGHAHKHVDAEEKPSKVKTGDLGGMTLDHVLALAKKAARLEVENAALRKQVREFEGLAATIKKFTSSGGGS
jgi:uncharacterized C2H2 Zn-finger protein